MIAIKITEGWSERIPVRLYRDGVPFNYPSYGFTFAGLVIHDKNGSEVSLQGTSGEAAPSTGDVYYDPDPGGEFLNVLEPYRVRAHLTKAGRDAYVPNDAGLPMRVSKI